MSSPGEYIERWDGVVRATAQSEVLDLIGRVRAKCPYGPHGWR